MYMKAAFGLIAVADEPPELPIMMLPPLLVAVASGGSARLTTEVDDVLDAV